MLEQEEKDLTVECVRMALVAGAQKARASLNKNNMNIVATLDGEVDRISACLDRSISLNLFVDGRYGSFSTNKLEREALRSFIGKAVGTVRMLAEDLDRDLPGKERTATDAVTGRELGIYDDSFREFGPQRRIDEALRNCFREKSEKGWKLVSEEGEWSDSESFNFIADSDGLRALHSETSFEFFDEVTIEDSEGNKFTGGWWEAAPLLKDFHPEKVAPAALREAVMQIGPRPCRSGKYRMVLDSEVSSKVFSPILNALNAFSIQQKNSFMVDSLGKRVFPGGLDIMDIPRTEGQACGKMFDSEGVATSNHYIIKDGKVQEYFVNTYMSNKLDLPPTIEDATRPVILPWLSPAFDKGIAHGDKDAIMALCGEGIYVTDFCGGNCNSATGDFSYAIQGYRFKDGAIVHPVREMLITGNLIKLWAGLIAAGNDARPCRAKLTPTLAFEGVDFSG